MGWLHDRMLNPRDVVGPIARPVDTSAQIKSRKLRERGGEDGAREFPRTNAEQYSTAEQEIIADILAERDRLGSDLCAALRSYRDALSRLQTGMDVAVLRQEADNAVRRLREKRASWRGTTAELRKRALTATDEFAAFKSTHRLDRSPRLPKDGLFSAAMLVVSVLIESIVNGLFFANGSDSGLLGGVSLALAVSIVNVCIGAANGFVFLRLAQRSRLVESVPAATIFVFVCVFEILLNAFIAHYRDAYQISGDQTSVRAEIFKVAEGIFDLDSIYSWLLFFLGLVVSCFSVWKGYTLDDPYPGYGSHERRRLAAVTAYDAHRQEVIEEASDINEDYSSLALDKIEQLRAASSERESISAARARRVGEFRSSENNLAEAARVLLAAYREANLAARKTLPPPHFCDQFAFEGNVLDLPHVRDLLQDCGWEFDAQALIDELDGLRQKVTNEHTATLSEAPQELPL